MVWAKEKLAAVEQQFQQVELADQHKKEAYVTAKTAANKEQRSMTHSAAFDQPPAFLDVGRDGARCL